MSMHGQFHGVLNTYEDRLLQCLTGNLASKKLHQGMSIVLHFYQHYYQTFENGNLRGEKL